MLVFVHKFLRLSSTPFLSDVKFIVDLQVALVIIIKKLQRRKIYETR